MSNKIPEALVVPEGIKTVYRWRGKKVKTNRSQYLNETVATAYRHMQINHYGANYCEILNAETDEVYAEVFRSMKGTVRIEHHYDPTGYERKYSINGLLFDGEEP